MTLTSAQTAETALRRPWWRRPVVLAAAAAVLVAVLAAAVLLLPRAPQHGLSRCRREQRGRHRSELERRSSAKSRLGSDLDRSPAGEGAIWVGNLDDRTLTRIERHAADIRQARSPSAIGRRRGSPPALGAVWVAHGMRGEVSRVDPQFNRVTKTVPVASPLLADGERSRRGGLGLGCLRRLDPLTHRPRRCRRPSRRRVGGQVPSAIVVGSGAIWVADVGDSTVKRFNPATFEQGAGTVVRRGQPTRSESHSAKVRSGSRTPRTTRSTRVDPVHRVDANGRRRTGPDGRGSRVWRRVGRRTRPHATVSRIDPAANKVVETIDIGNAPVRPRSERRPSLGRRSGAVVGATSGRRRSGRASDEGRCSRPGGHQRRFVEEADRCGRRCVTGERDVEVAVRAVARVSLRGDLLAACESLKAGESNRPMLPPTEYRGSKRTFMYWKGSA